MHTIARREVGLDLDGDACRLIVEALAERPFRQVFELIGQLHAGAAPDGGSARFTLSAPQLRLVLDALGGMPFQRVQGLLHNMHRQMRTRKD